MSRVREKKFLVLIETDRFYIFLFITCVFLNFCPLFAQSNSKKDALPGQLDPKNYNIILIILDSVRADHLGCYNYFRKTSPAIDRLAHEGILFEQAISQASWSLPSHCSIFTSRYVATHDVDSYDEKLSDSEVTLAEILKIYGYETVAFTGGFFISSLFNLGQGFDIYREDLTFAKMADSVPAALDWLKVNRGKKFFLLLQGFDGHSPFNLPGEYEKKYADPHYQGIFKGALLDHRIGDRLSGYTYWIDYDRKTRVDITDEDISYIKDQYDGSIAYADKYIGDFLAGLDKLGLRDNTIVIFTSYHGTPLFEHGIILRRKQGGLFEGVIRVPLIIRHPDLDKRGIRIPCQVRHIDIMPTILDFLKIPLNHQAQGRSLLPLTKAGGEDEFDPYAFSSGYKEEAVRTEKWKLIDLTGYGKGLQLYDLKNDPQEKINLIQKNPKIASLLKEKLSGLRGSSRYASEEINRISPQEITKIKDKLKKAGYWFWETPRAAIGRDDK